MQGMSDARSQAYDRRQRHQSVTMCGAGKKNKIWTPNAWRSVRRPHQRSGVAALPVGGQKGCHTRLGRKRAHTVPQVWLLLAAVGHGPTQNHSRYGAYVARQQGAEHQIECAYTRRCSPLLGGGVNLTSAMQSSAKTRAPQRLQRAPHTARRPALRTHSGCEGFMPSARARTPVRTPSLAQAAQRGRAGAVIAPHGGPVRAQRTSAR